MQIPIKSILVFHAAARAGSISRAAEELSVTPSAVSQQIQLLEGQLGTTLMARTGRKVTLTEAGERYFSMITAQIEQISDATDSIRGFRSVTTLTIRATPTISNKWLLPRLGSFLEEHPELEVRLDGTNEPTDFSQELVDIELRHGDGRWPGLFVEGLVEEEFLPVCSPDMPGAGAFLPEDLQNQRHSVKAQAQWNHWFPLCGVTAEKRWRRVLFDRSHMAIDAAVLGIGVALESTLMMERELQRGMLVPAVADAPRIKLVTQWIVCPHSHLRQRKVTLFLEWMRKQRDEWQTRRVV